MKKRRTITIETHQVQILRARAPAPGEAWCAGCAALTSWLTPEAAAALTRTTTRAVYRVVEAGGLHFVETAEGGLLLCQASVAVWASSKL